MAAKKKEIKKLDAAALGLSREALEPKQQVRRIYFPEKTKQTQMLEGSSAEVAAKLIEKLKNEARVF
jgi:electron transfer flavoprotein beta subunit